MRQVTSLIVSNQHCLCPREDDGSVPIHERGFHSPDKSNDDANLRGLKAILDRVGPAVPGMSMSGRSIVRRDYNDDNYYANIGFAEKDEKSRGYNPLKHHCKETGDQVSKDILGYLTRNPRSSTFLRPFLETQAGCRAVTATGAEFLLYLAAKGKLSIQDGGYDEDLTVEDMQSLLPGLKILSRLMTYVLNALPALREDLLFVNAGLFRKWNSAKNDIKLRELLGMYFRPAPLSAASQSPTPKIVLLHLPQNDQTCEVLAVYSAERHVCTVFIYAAGSSMGVIQDANSRAERKFQDMFARIFSTSPGKYAWWGSNSQEPPIVCFSHRFELTSKNDLAQPSLLVIGTAMKLMGSGCPLAANFKISGDVGDLFRYGRLASPEDRIEFATTLDAEMVRTSFSFLVLKHQKVREESFGARSYGSWGNNADGASPGTYTKLHTHPVTSEFPDSELETDRPAQSAFDEGIGGNDGAFFGEKENGSAAEYGFDEDESELVDLEEPISLEQDEMELIHLEVEEMTGVSISKNISMAERQDENVDQFVWTADDRAVDNLYKRFPYGPLLYSEEEMLLCKNILSEHYEISCYEITAANERTMVNAAASLRSIPSFGDEELQIIERYRTRAAELILNQAMIVVSCKSVAEFLSIGNHVEWRK